MPSLEQLESTYTQAAAELSKITSGDALEAWERRYLGKKGEITLALRSVGQIAPEERAAFGKRANEIKNALGRPTASGKKRSASTSWPRRSKRARST